jgi:hypothetical protein
LAGSPGLCLANASANIGFGNSRLAGQFRRNLSPRMQQLLYEALEDLGQHRFAAVAGGAFGAGKQALFIR